MDLREFTYAAGEFCPHEQGSPPATGTRPLSRFVESCCGPCLDDLCGVEGDAHEAGVLRAALAGTPIGDIDADLARRLILTIRTAARAERERRDRDG